jgi:hypothetical protein
LVIVEVLRVAGRPALSTRLLMVEQLSGLRGRRLSVEAEDFAAAADLRAGLAGARLDRRAEEAA